MDRLVAYYIDDEKATSIPSDGNVMIRVGGVSIDGAKSDMMIIIGDGVGKTNVSFTNAELTDRLVVRGGDRVTIAGSFGDVRVVLPYITLDCGNAETKRIYGCKDSVIDIGTLTASDTTSDTASDNTSDKTEESADAAKTETGSKNTAEDNGASAEK